MLNPKLKSAFKEIWLQIHELNSILVLYVYKCISVVKTLKNTLFIAHEGCLYGYDLVFWKIKYCFLNIKLKIQNFSILFVLFYLNPVYGQLFSEFDFKYKTFTIKDGLAHDAVKKCMMDSKGFLWIITENGLSRFDGHTFKNFKNVPNDTTSLPANNLTDLIIDRHDNIWLAYDFGVCIFDAKTYKSKQIKYKGKNVLGEKMAYDKELNHVYVCSHTQGLYKIDAETRKAFITSESKLQPSFLWQMMIDKHKKLWISFDRSGYLVFDTKLQAGHFYNTSFWPTGVFPKNDSIYYATTFSNELHEININDPQNIINTWYIKTEKYGYDQVDLMNIIRNKELFGKNVLAISTQVNSIFLFDEVTKKFIKNIRYRIGQLDGFPTDFLHWAYTDPNGISWFCSWNSGLIMLSKEFQQFQKVEVPELNTNFYNCVTGIKDDPTQRDIAWLTAMGTGIAKVDKKTGKFQKWFYRDLDKDGNDPHYDQRWVLPLMKDNNNTLWTVSYNCFIKIKDSQVKHIIANDSIVGYFDNCFMDKNYNIWASARNITYFDTKKEKTKSYYLPDRFRLTNSIDYINTLEMDDNQHLLVGTDWGLFELDTAAIQFRKINYCQNLQDSSKWEYIKALVKINDKLYIGTKNGVLEYNFITLKSKILGSYLENTYVPQSGMTKDRYNNLWVYCTKGIIRYNPITSEMYQFTKNDGAYTHSVDNGYFFEYNDNMYIGHRMAYTKFNPGLINTYKKQPISVVTEVAHGNTTVLYSAAALNQKLELTHDNPNITIYFTGIEYNFPEKILFSTYLEGFDKVWSEPNSNRTRQFTNLPPGSYTFKVKAQNPLIKGDNRYDSFTFEVSPAFWQTWWFKAISILSFVGGVIYIARWRIKQIKKREKEKTKANKMIAELDAKLLRSQMNPHFIFNSLNSIQKYIWENNEEDAAEYLSKFAKLMRGILENSAKDYIILAEEFNMLKLYLELEHKRSNGHFDYIINIDTSIDQHVTLTPPLLLQPFIENAIWHGLNRKSTHGNLIINVKRKGNYIEFSVDDDGVGRNNQNEQIKTIDKKSLGISITQQRIEKLFESFTLKGSIEVIDKIKKDESDGTCVIISLPIKLSNEA